MPPVQASTSNSVESNTSVEALAVQTDVAAGAAVLVRSSTVEASVAALQASAEIARENNCAESKDTVKIPNVARAAALKVAAETAAIGPGTTAKLEAIVAVSVETVSKMMLIAWPSSPSLRPVPPFEPLAQRPLQMHVLFQWRPIQTMGFILHYGNLSKGPKNVTK